MELCEATLKTTVGQDVKASVFLLLDSLVRDTAKAKSLLTIVLGKSLFPGGDLGVISDLIPLFFVLLALITLLQTVFILNIVVDRVVHQAVILNFGGELLDFVFAVVLRLFISLLNEILLLFLVVVLSLDGVVLIQSPERFGSLRSLHIIIRLHLQVV